jgi:hypothetical protein
MTADSRVTTVDRSILPANGACSALPAHCIAILLNSIFTVLPHRQSTFYVVLTIQSRVIESLVNNEAETMWKEAVVA